MKKPILIAAALALAGTAGVASAQYADNNQTYRPVAANGYWQGAPDGLRQRIDWLQQRIDRGVADGSLSRREARRAQWQLNDLRRQAHAPAAPRRSQPSIRWGAARYGRYGGGGYGGGGNGGWAAAAIPTRPTTTPRAITATIRATRNAAWARTTRSIAVRTAATTASAATARPG